MRKIITIMLALVMLVTLTACGGNEKNKIKLGTSDFSIVVPEGYKAAEDDISEDQVAYYYKDDDSIDFDVYQWTKDGQYTLEEEAQYFAGEYGAELEKVTVNGIDCMKYISEEEYEGDVYTVVNYMFEDEDSIVELCFWTVDSAEEYAAVEDIIETLKKD